MGLPVRLAVAFTFARAGGEREVLAGERQLGQVVERDVGAHRILPCPGDPQARLDLLFRTCRVAAGETRRVSVAQLRAAVLADRGAHVRDFGAKGDGTTDDAPAIQAAVNDLKNRGGGTLLFGPRTYRIASPVVVDGALVGIVSIGDVVKARLDELEEERRQLVEYIQTP